MRLERIGPFEYRRYPPVLPALDAAGREARRHPVLIVGGGPVGLTTALGLARWGIASVVIEADDSVCEGSRAACTSRRSLEIADRYGFARRLMAKGLPWTRGRSFYGTEEVFVLEMPSAPGDKYPPMINIEQYYIEEFLLETIAEVNAASPGLVEVRWASRVVGHAQDAQGVTVEVENALGRYRTCADWLVATDGGQSTIRSQLGLELKGVGYQGRYAIVDIELASTYPTERRAWFDPPWARGTTILMHRQPDDIWRVDYQLAAGQDAALVMQPGQVRQFVQTHLDAIGEGHLKWEPVWSSIYRAGAMTLDGYRHGPPAAGPPPGGTAPAGDGDSHAAGERGGRVFFAGNSAHAMPIFGVRGLNSGFDDADNLVWKLAAVIRGRGGDALLDTYSSERVHAFRVNAESAMRSTEFMSPPNRGFELMREAALSLAAKHKGIARLVSPRQTHAITYEGSALSSASDAFEAGPAPGVPLADAPVTEGQHLTDLLARSAFTLLVFGASHAAGEVVDATHSTGWKALPCEAVTLDAEGDLAHRYGAREGSLYLVRPDGHVAGRWREAAAATVLAAIRRACQLQGEPA